MKPLMQTSKQTGFLPESCRMVRVQQKDVCRMGCGGQAERVSPDGVPTVRGEDTCQRIMSGQAIVNLGGTAEVFRLLSQEIKPKPVFSVDEGLFCCPSPGETNMRKEKQP